MTLLASPSRERRKRALMPNGEPRYVHCYDNGVTKKPTFDRYTIVFTRKKNGTGPRSEFLYLGASEHPFHPQGFGQHGSSPTQIEKAISDSVDTAHDANVVVAKLPRGTEYRVTRHVLTTVLRGVKE